MRALKKIPLLLAAMATLAGCSIHLSEGIRVVSDKDKKTLTETFPASFISRGDGGDYQILLLKDRANKTSSPEPGAPLPPLALADVRQIVHIHVFWQPMRGAKPDNPSATNAAIDWYLVRADGTKITGIAHYEGAGFTTLDINSDSAEVTLRSAALKPTRIEGNIVDPVGPLTLSGQFTVLHRPSAVNDVLAQLDQLKLAGVNSGVDPVRLTEPASAAARAQ